LQIPSQDQHQNHDEIEIETEEERKEPTYYKDEKNIDDDGSEPIKSSI